MNIEPLVGESGVELTDPIRKARFVLRTPAPVSPTLVDTEALDFPVETAVEMQTSAINSPRRRGIFIRDTDGSLRFESAGDDDTARLPDDEYIVEFGNAPMKVYFSVSSSIRFQRTDSGSTLSFDGSSRVILGIRSTTRKPAGTITVTNDPDDIMRALSLLGSLLKTTSPERSYPSRRGHPPLIERGEQFHVSSAIEPGESETTLVLPPELEYLYPATPLAYYLNSSVVSGTQPRLIAGDFEYELDGKDGYERTVEHVLQKVFFLECLTRIDGFYPITLHERELVEPRVSLDFDSLFDAPLEARLPAYLDVPFAALEHAISPWHQVIDMVPTTENVQILPFVADKLAFVRMAQTPNGGKPKAQRPETLQDFLRESTPQMDVGTKTPPNIFEMDGEPDALQHAWVGPGYPYQRSKLTYESLYASAMNKQGDNRAATATISVTIVCNDPSMQSESHVARYYNLRDLPRFDVSIYHQITKEKLRDHLTTQTDFFHYIGHISDDGIKCEDGYLDARTISNIDATTFLLNACSSYVQGRTLVERGAVAGAVTLSKIGNTTATKVGQSFVRMLSTGFSVQTALSLIHRYFLTGYNYTAIGDGDATLCQSESGVVHRLVIESADSGCFNIRIDTFVNNYFQQGSFVELSAEKEARYHLPGGETTTVELSPTELNDFFSKKPMPVEIDGDLYWSDEISADDVAEVL
ncbi:hypothetical protein SAMN05421858_2793 [Haladaptatus litoreus]|uniref:CHAT domain-containing protein n=1 Tax=Haladaptatus litoreus TaxID=553468 RepID=A0A1N7BVZ4_9EURY|nr:hypothetical protein [Haladaptatus litoreus]SIR55537.1 hypothetical protein SAMN05421858_2793 [Haladaptatus litoreus]